MNEEQKKILAELRELYGDNFQLMVSIEELNELACVLCKYPRYDDSNRAVEELKKKVLDEYVDVVIILDHVKNIFGLTDEEINTHLEAKIDRVRRWVESDNHTPQQTLIDREVKDAHITRV